MTCRRYGNRSPRVLRARRFAHLLQFHDMPRRAVVRLQCDPHTDMKGARHSRIDCEPGIEPRMTTMQSDPDSRAMASRDGLASPARIDAGPARRHRRIDAGWALVPIVAASGFAGLGYEIVWTRQSCA